MLPPARPYAACFSLGVAFFLLATLVSDVVARTTVGSEGFGHAISQHAYYAVTGPTGTGMLLAPFLLVAWMAASLARRKTMRRGVAFLCAACSVLTIIYFVGYQDSQHYMTQGMWTAATLTIGFLVFKSVPVVVVALVAFLFLRRGVSREG
jgi:biotin transporter BioY